MLEGHASCALLFPAELDMVHRGSRLTTPTAQHRAVHTGNGPPLLQRVCRAQASHTRATLWEEAEETYAGCGHGGMVCTRPTHAQQAEKYRSVKISVVRPFYVRSTL